jgi:hypothetical protein
MLIDMEKGTVIPLGVSRGNGLGVFEIGSSQFQIPSIFLSPCGRDVSEG